MTTEDRERERDPGLHRVRVGVTGLAAVFLLTLLAASLFAFLGPDSHAPVTPQAARAAATAAQEQPKEPLAELGVAPGGNGPKTVPGNSAQPAAVVPTVPAPHAPVRTAP